MCNSNLEGKTLFGDFDDGLGGSIPGNISFSGNKTILELHGNHVHREYGRGNHCINGTLCNGKKISALDCVILDEKISSYLDDSRRSTQFFPHYVAIGRDNVHLTSSFIQSISFSISDGHALFQTQRSFGHIFDAQEILEKLFRDKQPEVPYAIESGAEIFYTTGRRILLDIETELGRVEAFNSMLVKLPSNNGIDISNAIRFSIEPSEPESLEKLIKKTWYLERFLSIIIGRKQQTQKLKIKLNSDIIQSGTEIYISMLDKDKSEEGHNSRDLLINADEDAESFKKVLCDWIKRNEEWRSSRFHYFQSFKHRNSFGPDRLIRGANTFDLLPSNYSGPKPVLSNDLLQAKNDSIEIFKRLPVSSERDSILGALGRLGKKALKEKINYRSSFIHSSLPDRFPELDLVISEAVNCRNYYVHGGKQSFDYFDHVQESSFLSLTLEFIFGMSDLIEAGWDPKKWAEGGHTLRHPFSEYIIEYPKRLGALKNLLN